MKNHFKKLMHNVENQIENDFRNHLNNFLTTRKNQIDNNLRNNFKESSWRKIISVMIWEIISMKSTKKHIIKQSTHQPWIQQHNKDKFHTKKKPLHPK
jgi:hypothetical protein